MIPISEIFHSLQGEGRNTGKPSIFIRFWGCNLRCKWCDTPYAVLDIKDMKKYYLGDVLEAVQSFPCKHIIFTGGEPSLYENHIAEIQKHLPGYTFEIETNGSIKLNNRYDQVNVSYKTNNSGTDDYYLMAISDKYDYKFVVKDERDLQEVEGIIKENKLPIDNIYLMPLGITKQSQINKIVVDYCIKKGYRYCQRMHILLFGNRKGV